MESVFVSTHPLVQHKLTELRDVRTEPKRFRELIREVTWLLLYEATADLPLERCKVSTPMGVAVGGTLGVKIAFAPVLRAGLGMIGPALELIPNAHVWHIGLYREEETLQPIEYYTKVPSPATAEIAFVLDPMLATGGSAVAAVDILKSSGVSQIKFVGIVAALEGLEKFTVAHPNVDVRIVAVDKHLNEIGYIVPGLGDAGNRLFGTT